MFLKNFFTVGVVEKCFEKISGRLRWLYMCGARVTHKKAWHPPCNSKIKGFIMLNYTKAQRAHLLLVNEVVVEVMRDDYINHIITDVNEVLDDINDHSPAVNLVPGTWLYEQVMTEQHQMILDEEIYALR